MSQSTQPSTTPYETLTDLQQRTVDAYALRNLGELDNVKDCLEYVREEHPDTVEGTITGYASKLSDVINEREKTLVNEHDKIERGNVTVEGTIDLTDLPKPQTIDDRPYQEEREETIECPHCSVELDATGKSPKRVLNGHKRWCPEYNPDESEEIISEPTEDQDETDTRVNPFGNLALFELFDEPIQVTMDTDVRDVGDMAVYVEPRDYYEFLTFDPSQLDTAASDYEISVFTKDGSINVEFLLQNKEVIEE